MAKRIDGITIAIKADTSGVTKSLHEVSSQSVNLSKSLKTVNSLLKLDPGNAELLSQKQKILADSIKVTTEKLNALKSAQEDVKAQFERGEIGTDQYLAFQNEVVRTEKRLQSLQAEAEEAGNDVEDLGDDAKEAGKDMEKAESAASKLGNALKTGLATGAKVAAAAAAGAAAFSLAKEVVLSFGELEQNLGGSEAVFGEYADRIQKTGEEAYKNLGVSQSEYLASANKMGALLQGSGFSAKQSLDMTEQALQRAADMASVMGIDTTSALEAVNGAAKGNFTMMDNLGVAINDTTLQAYAQEKGLGELATTQDKVSAAMQLFLEKTQQYDGNFAREATETVSGSLGLLSASWGSLIAGLGNSEADITNLTENVADALTSVVENIQPVIENIVQSLPTILNAVIPAISGLLPILLPMATGLFVDVLNALIGMLPTLIPFAVDAIMTIGNALIQNIPLVIEAALLLVQSLADSLGDNLDTIVPAVIKMVTQIVLTLTDPSTLVSLIEAAIAILVALANGIVESLPALLETMPVVVDNVVQALITAAPMLITAAIEIIAVLADGILNNLGKILSASVQIVLSVIDGILSMYSQTGEAIDGLMDSIWETIRGYFSGAVTWGSDLIDNFITGIRNGIGKVADAARNIAETVKSYIGFSEPELGPLSNFHTYAPDMMQLFAEGIKDNEDLITNQFAKSLSGIGISAEITRASSAAPSFTSPVFNVNVNVGSIANDYDVHRMTDGMVQEISSRLDLLKRQQTAATGGVYV